jgi:hypothetical protein
VVEAAMSTQGELMIYGPNTSAVQAIINRISTLTTDQVNILDAFMEASWDASRDAALAMAWDRAWDAFMEASWDASRDAALAMAWDRAWDEALHTARHSFRKAWNNEAKYAALDAAWDKAKDMASHATLATVTYDLATIEGPYTIAQRDLLLAPWVIVCGMPEQLDANASLVAERDRYRNALAAGKRWADLHRQWGNTPLSVDPLDNLYPTEANEAMFDFVELCRALDGEA